LSLNDTRYVLVEPPHHVAPARMEDLFFDILVAGYVPVLTHPERLTWIRHHHAMIERLARSGTLMQITAGSLSGRFGREPRYWAERLLDEGLVHLLATDAHDLQHRPPDLSRARDRAAERVGDDEAHNLVYIRPMAMVSNRAPAELPATKRAQFGGHDENRSASASSDLGDRSRESDRHSGGLSDRLRRLFDR
jgi:protein-tyrosine phosphatase